MATSMWNNVSSSPPVASCSYDCYEIDEEDVNNLKLALEAVQIPESGGQCLASDQYTLSRLLYKANNQQRQWRWYQMLKRIQKCLKSLQASHLAKFIDDAVYCCQINRSETGCTIHLPSRQMLEFVLMKLMGRAKLCAYVLHMAESVFAFVMQNITSGQFLAHNTIYAAIVSRIWVVMRVMMRDLIGWYDDLRPWGGRLAATPMQWMPEGESLPDSLRDWLKADYDMDEYTKAIDLTSKKKGGSLLDKMFAAGQKNHGATSTTWQPNKGQDKHEVAMATAVLPSIDLGEPVSAKETAGKRSKVKLKRKRSESGHGQEPGTKRSRPDVASPGEGPPDGRLEDSGAEAIGADFESGRGGKKQARKMERTTGNKRKHLEGAPKHLDLDLKDVDRATLQESAAEERNRKASLKKKLKRKLEKLAKVRSGKGGKVKGRSRKDLLMKEVEPQKEEGLEEGTDFDIPPERDQPRAHQGPKKNSKTTKTAKKFVQSKKENRKEQLKMKLEKLAKVRSGKSGKVKGLSRKDMSTKELEAQKEDGLEEGTDFDIPPERDQPRAHQRPKKNSKTTKTAKESVQSKREDKVSWKQKLKLQQEGPVTKNRDKKTRTPQSKIEGDHREKPKKLGKLQSMSSLVCELGSLSRGAPGTGSQESDIDSIFALLE